MSEPDSYYIQAPEPLAALLDELHAVLALAVTGTDPESVSVLLTHARWLPAEEVPGILRAAADELEQAHAAYIARGIAELTGERQP